MNESQLLPFCFHCALVQGISGSDMCRNMYYNKSETAAGNYARIVWTPKTTKSEYAENGRL